MPQIRTFPSPTRCPATRFTKPFALLASTFVLALLLVACGGSDGGDEATDSPQASGTGTYNVLPVSGAPYVGENRVAFAIQDPDNLPVDATDVHVRFYRIQGETGKLAGEADATQHRFENFFPHIHPDGSTHVHNEPTLFYTVDSFDFDTEGYWGYQVVATLPNGQQVQAQTAAFPVTASPSWPVPGRPAPTTHNQTVNEVTDIAEIDTSVPPRPFMHQVAIDEALAQKKPFVVTFSTPAFCQSQVCGPVTDVVASLYPTYGDRIAFIHVEPYDLDVLYDQQKYQLTQIVLDWGIPSEPWTFVVGADGKVVADFGGLFAPEELDAAIQKALA